MWYTSYPFSYALVVRKYIFRCFGAENDLSEEALAAGKNKSRPKCFQTSVNTILLLSETDSFDKKFMASWVVKLVANSLQTSTVGFQNWKHKPTSTSVFERSSFASFQPCSYFSIHHPCMIDGYNCSGRWIGGVHQRTVILGFPISISSCVDRFLKTETWARKHVRP